MSSVTSSSTRQARSYIETQAPRRFRFARIVDALPDISQATIRDALEDLRAEGLYTVGRGRWAMWERVGDGDALSGTPGS